MEIVIMVEDSLEDLNFADSFLSGPLSRFLNYDTFSFVLGEF